MSVTAIAEHLGIDRKTVRKYMKSDKVLSRLTVRGNRNSIP